MTVSGFTSGAGGAIGEAKIRIRADTSGFAKETEDGVTSGIGSIAGTVGKAMLLVGAAAAAGLAAFSVKAFDQAEAAEKVANATAAVIKSTGGIANVSAAQVDKLATSLSAKSAVDRKVIASGENVLLTFTQVRNEAGKGNDIFDQTTVAALNMSRALGNDLQSSVLQIGKALNDPIKGITALQRAGVQFTQEQRDQIKALVASGDALDAQKLILGELTKEFGGAAEANATSTEKIKTAFVSIEETVGKVFLPLVASVADFLVGTVVPLFDKVWPAAVAATSAAFHDVIQVVGDVVDALVGGFQNPAATIGASVQGWEGFLLRLGAAFRRVAEAAREAWPTVAKIVKDTLGDLAGPIKVIATDVVPRLTAALSDVFGFVGDHLAAFTGLNDTLSKFGDVLVRILPSVLAMVVALHALSVAGEAAKSIATLGSALSGLAVIVEPLLAVLTALGTALVALVGAPVLIAAAIILAIAAALALLYFKVQPVHDAMDALGRLFAGAFKSSLDWIINTAWPALRDGTEAVGKALSDFGGTVADVAATLSGSLGTGIDDITKAFDKMTDGVRGAWEAFRLAIQPTVDWYDQHVGPTIVAGAQLVVAIWDRLVQATRMTWTIIATVWGALAPIIGAAARAMIDIITPLLQGLLGIFHAVFDTIGPLVEAAFGIVVAVTQAAFDVLAPIVTSALSLIEGTFAIFGGVIGDVLRTAFDLAVGIIGGALDVIRGIFEILTGIITLHWSKAWQGIQDIVGGVVGAVEAGLTAFFAFIDATTSAAMAAVKLLFQTAWDLITGIFQGAWAALQVLTQAGLDTVRAIIETGLGLVVAIVQTAWGAITGAVSAAWATIRAEVSTGVATVVAEIGKLPGLAVAALSSLADALFNVARDALEHMVSGVAAGAVDLFHWFAGLPAQLVGFLGDVGHILFDAGARLVDGFLAGIRSKAGDVAGAIAKLANPGLAIGDFIGSHIPGLASGGVVPGARGAAWGGVVHGGEVVLNPGQQADVLMAIANGGGGGGSSGPAVNIENAYFANDLDLDQLARSAGYLMSTRGALAA